MACRLSADCAQTELAAGLAAGLLQMGRSVTDLGLAQCCCLFCRWTAHLPDSDVAGFSEPGGHFCVLTCKTELCTKHVTQRWGTGDSQPALFSYVIPASFLGLLQW